jgi:replicative DNA helicase
MTDAESKMIDFINDAERAIVGLVMRDGAEVIPVAEPILRSSDFRDGDLGELYQVAVDMHAARVEITMHSFVDECMRRGTCDKVGDSTLSEVYRQAVGYYPRDAEYYAERIATFAQHRRLVDAARRIVNGEFTLDPKPVEAKARFDAETDGVLRGSGSRPVTFADAVDEVVALHRQAALNGELLGMPTGFPSLDAITGGFHRGQLVLLGGRTFVGKTALGLAFASNFAQKNRRVMFISLEMSRVELAERILADDCGFELRQFTQTGLSDDEISTIESGRSEYARWPFTISDSAIETTATIRAKAKLQKASGLDLLVVDNLQLVRHADYSMQRRLQLCSITSDLKRLAKELDCCVLLLAQLNADAENKEPDDTHYSESKQILADADIAMLAHRESKTDSDFALLVTKNRRGTQGRITLRFDGAYQRFTDPSVGVEWR